MLHLISSSPFQNTALEECLKIAQRGDALVLMADAVYSARMEARRFADLQVFALADHMNSRGVATPSWITSINYDQLVELTCQQHPLQTWT